MDELVDKDLDGGRALVAKRFGDGATPLQGGGRVCVGGGEVLHVDVLIGINLEWKGLAWKPLPQGHGPPCPPPFLPASHLRKLDVVEVVLEGAKVGKPKGAKYRVSSPVNVLALLYHLRGGWGQAWWSRISIKYVSGTKP
jgi:hypothetical protein